MKIHGLMGRKIAPTSSRRDYTTSITNHLWLLLQPFTAQTQKVNSFPTSVSQLQCPRYMACKTVEIITALFYGHLGTNNTTTCSRSHRHLAVNLIFGVSMESQNHPYC